jgi:uncharacterized membrane protein (DUF485 family)
VSDSDKLRAIRAKTRMRLLFSLVTLCAYFAFVLNWIDGPDQVLASPVGDSPLNGSLLFFIGLIVGFILLELLFLYIYRVTSGGGK